MPLSGWPSVMEKNGIASTASTATLTMAHGHGRSLTLRPQLANAECSCCSSVAAAVRSASSRDVSPALRALSRDDRARTFALDTPMNAGTRVSAASMVIATTIAAARPSAPTNATSEMYRPRMATTTVLPATTIAAPEVPSVLRAEVMTSMPTSMCSRCLATMNRP